MSCGEPPGDAELAVRAWVAEAEAAAENRDRIKMLGLISKSYEDAGGNEREDLSDMLRFYFAVQKQVAIVTKVEEITVLGRSAAEVSLIVGMAGTNESALGLSADTMRFEFDLEYDGDEWLLMSMRQGESAREL
jgi:hypothetical protein